MPWTPKDAPSHTKRAKTKHTRQIWSAAANNALKEYGDDARAIRVANAAVNAYLDHHEKADPILTVGDVLMINKLIQKAKKKQQTDAEVRDAINGLIGAVGHPGHALVTTRPITSM